MNEKYFSKKDLEKAKILNIFTSEQIVKFENFIEKEGSSLNPNPPFKIFSGINIAYYISTLLILLSLFWFKDLNLGGLGLSVLSISCGIIFIIIGRKLWLLNKFKITAGLLFTFAVLMTPLFVYGVQQYVGATKEFTLNNFMLLQIFAATIITNLIMLYFIKFAFLITPLLISCWRILNCLIKYIPLNFLNKQFITQDKLLVWCSLFFGIITFLISYLIDKKTKEDFAFWGYIIGIIIFEPMFFTLLNLYSISNKESLWICLITNIFFILISALLNNKILLFFGTSLTLIYYIFLLIEYFQNTILLPLTTITSGIFILFLTILYVKNKNKIDNTIQNLIPKFILKLRPENRLMKKN